MKQGAVPIVKQSIEGPYLHKYLIGQDGYRDQHETQVPIKATNDNAIRLILGI